MRKPAWLTALAVSGALLAGPALSTPAAAAAGAAGSRHRAGPLVAAAPAGVHAAAAAIANASTGALLWARHPDAERPVASITKVMTALVVIQAGHLDRAVTIPAAVVAYTRKYDASNAGLHPGDQLTARQLLAALLLPSGCDAAYALAAAYGPGLAAFIARMNATAARLGMTHTHFANFDGLPWPTEYSTYSTPADLIILGRAAMHYPAFRATVNQAAYQVAAGPRHHGYRWRNTNLLLRSYRGTSGIKTGFTRGAGYSLLFEAQRGPAVLIGVVLDSSPSHEVVSFSDATAMLNWGFAAR